jgi:hypothetical protein
LPKKIHAPRVLVNKKITSKSRFFQSFQRSPCARCGVRQERARIELLSEGSLCAVHNCMHALIQWWRGRVALECTAPRLVLELCALLNPLLSSADVVLERVNRRFPIITLIAPAAQRPGSTFCVLLLVNLLF